METAAPPADMPSPTKKAYAPAIAPVQPADGVRGSMRVHTPYDEQLRTRPAFSRQAVAHGTAPSSSSRRPLGPSRTEPFLSFAQPQRPSDVGTFRSGLEVLEHVYGVTDGKRRDELRPMWETSTNDDASSVRSGGAFGRSASLAGGDSGFGSAAGMHGSFGAGDAAGDGGDGFDLDEAFGPSRSKLNFGNLDAAAAAGGEDSQQSHSTTRTITQGLRKRALDDDDAGFAAAAMDGDEIEMDATDVEDEDDDQANALKGFLQPNGERKTAGIRRGWTRTQSLPASAFEGKMDF
ncbi:hypothetical protein Rhopal_001465-T1 [Rhodotorula paludigena]|uniref:Uncharacterized protein n=1 Tax=Rhodotorula paludigena TaxID=86838 RepID=A0AAV5GF39_9BASI|nr:hypothetical protein Rhopal_001465-T1 [Rhodotorula paludigena]